MLEGNSINMKIYVTHSSNFDFKNELYLPLRNSDLNKDNEIILPHEDSIEQFSSEKMMSSFDLVIAEVSYPSTGQGIELGWATSNNVPVVCIYKKGIEYSGAIKTVSDTILEYQDPNDMIQVLEAEISKHG